MPVHEHNLLWEWYKIFIATSVRGVRGVRVIVCVCELCAFFFTLGGEIALIRGVPRDCVCLFLVDRSTTTREEKETRERF